MGLLITAIAMLAIVGLGLGVMIGKITPDDALSRLGVFVLIMCLAPALAACFKVALMALKPLLILLAVLVVVTVFVRALLTMKS